jgi:hypothetical protein
VYDYFHGDVILHGGKEGGREFKRAWEKFFLVDCIGELREQGMTDLSESVALAPRRLANADVIFG